MRSLSDRDLRELQTDWAVVAADCDLGLWHPADDVRELLGAGASEDEVRRVTLEALAPLLQAGVLRAVNLFVDGTYELWRGDVPQQLERIAEGWMAVGIPTIGDVVWFIGPSEPGASNPPRYEDR